ncbi:MAG: hypothetical protein WCH11_07555, partial [Bdellovibrio sp.]
VKTSQKWSKLLVGAGLVLFAGCSSPHKAEKLDTRIEKEDRVSGDTTLGVKNGDMVVQTKVRMSEELRSLQNDVFSLEDRVYGNRSYGSKGLYGVLRDCRSQLSDRKNGGDGKLIWTEPIDRVTERDREESKKIGLDEKDKLIGLSEEFLKDRIERFRGYRGVLEKRQDEYEEKVAVCQNELRNRRAQVEKAADKPADSTN